MQQSTTVKRHGRYHFVGPMGSMFRGARNNFFTGAGLRLNPCRDEFFTFARA
jgi:hypothetical protein